MEDIDWQEVSLFLHCHLRAYDKNGEGKSEDRSYLDQYGAPVETKNSWVEGYHEIEEQLNDNRTKLRVNKMKFPPILGLAGAAHLYKQFHENKPWNWTGWIPLQNQFYHKKKYINYRYYIGVRGNEIQNNLWDYPPREEKEGEMHEILQMTDPFDKYRGGYWFKDNAFGRYLHIIALKSHDVDPKTGKCRRYNYIVHPLAYRSAINTIPDNSVDAMQWCINNMYEEKHFGENKPWGERCHGLEIFNDFTYFYSYQPIEEGGPNNGELATPKDQRNKHEHYYYWFDTYALEFAEFLLNSGLARGSYFHTLTANDAYYERNVFEDNSDPKSSLYNYIMKQRGGYKVSALGLRKADREIDREKTLSSFVRALAYKERTVLGFVALFDPHCRIKRAVFEESDEMDLDKAGNIVLDYLVMGRFFSSTGIYDLFNYDTILPSQAPLLYTIKDQPDTREMCYDLAELELLFTFPAVKEENTDLVWRYTIMLETVDPENKQAPETIHGYFKLDNEGQTILDLTSYEKPRVKWLYFTAIRPSNPQHRAWFHAIRGPAFGDPKPKATLPPLEHHVETTHREGNLVTPATRINPTSVETDHLDFLLGTTTNEHDIYVYSMQVYPYQQNLTQEPVNVKIRESSDLIPPRILQSVHGYFNLRKDYPTRLNLCASWDSKTVEGPVLFYIVDGETGVPRPIPDSEKPILFGN